jgi:hypothetical protein
VFRQLCLQRCVHDLHGIEPSLQHARLMARVTELRLQRLDRTTMVRLALVRLLRGLVNLLLQLHDDAALAVNLEQRALFRRTQALLRALRRLAQLVQVA